MKHLVRLVLAALLLVGCEERPVPARTATPSATVSPASTATTMASPHASVAAAPGACPSGPARGLELNPPGPAGGDTVTLRAYGLDPGEYDLGIVSVGLGALFTHYPVGAVGSDGRLESTFVMPPAVPGSRAVAQLVGGSGRAALVCSAPFVTLPSKWAPGRCESLPEAVQVGLPLSVTVTPKPSGVEVTATGPRASVEGNGTGLVVVARLYFGDLSDPKVISDRIEIDDAVQVDRGMPTVRFSLNRSQWVGKCVQFAVYSQGPGNSWWYGRFTYP